MGEKASAFTKGGCGCIIAFFAIGLLAVLAGGSLRIDAGGFVALFVVGGVAGLVAWAIFGNRKPPQEPLPAAPRPWVCLTCDASNAADARSCTTCGSAR
jgi:hypothetical protein